MQPGINHCAQFSGESVENALEQPLVIGIMAVFLKDLTDYEYVSSPCTVDLPNTAGCTDHFKKSPAVCGYRVVTGMKQGSVNVKQEEEVYTELPAVSSCGSFSGSTSAGPSWMMHFFGQTATHLPQDVHFS